MTLKEFIEQIKEFAITCGCKLINNETEKGNAVFRNATEPFDEKSYFGFIREDEEHSGPYHDFSLVFFPRIDDNKNIRECVIALGVGSMGFANDYDIASLPWLRRLFTKLRTQGGQTYFKTDFSDIETPSNDLFTTIKNKYSALKKVIETYKNVLPASQILDFSDETRDNDNLKTIDQWIATYALFRCWASNKSQRDAIQKALPVSNNQEVSTNDIYNNLLQDRFIVLEGAPGTGKTFAALEVAKLFDEVCFEQFHAEITFSDFIYGIRPKLNSKKLEYEENKGILLQAIEKAEQLNSENKHVLLIIDEINRANLSNVLGPVFYLFEKNQSNHNYSLKIGSKEIKTLPDNLYVIATMNTADRSLAVVDFALRRRFTWMTLKPHVLENKSLGKKKFMKIEFEYFNQMFEKYASDDELNLQPGHSYFIAVDEKEMKHRLQYELMPLIKEYINEGFLTKSKDEFCNFFYEQLGVLMYE